MILGFTGTRQGMSPAQLAALPSVHACLPERVLHGGAVGADTEFNAFLLSTPCALVIEVYPIDRDRFLFWSDRMSLFTIDSGRTMLIHPVADPLIRNRIIAQRCDRLLACPATAGEELRSGTWVTVRYARKARKPITIIAPDGTIREEGP